MRPGKTEYSFICADRAHQTKATNLTQAQLNFTTQAVLDACDTLDGVKDGLIENPLQCHFNIDSLACGETSHPDKCLTSDQIMAAKNIYAGPRRSDNQESLYPGFALGSESEWLLQEGYLGNTYAVPVLKNIAFDDLNWDPASFDWSTDVDVIDRRASPLIDAISPNLSAYHQKGGKFMTSQGWTDPFNAAELPISHLKEIESFFGGDVSAFYRLFMIPGGGHCGAAQYSPSVPAQYHYLEPLIDWVEKSKPPKQILSSNPPDGSNRTRKLCPWPKTAHLIGKDASDWTSYRCE